jgi:hypothetical protein
MAGPRDPRSSATRLADRRDGRPGRAHLRRKLRVAVFRPPVPAAPRWVAMSPQDPGGDEPKIWFLIAMPGNLVALELVTAGAHATYFFRVMPRVQYNGEPPEKLGIAAEQAVRDISEALVDMRFLREPMALPADQLAAAEIPALPAGSGGAAQRGLGARAFRGADRPSRPGQLVGGGGGPDPLACTARDEAAEWPGRAAQESQISAAGGDGGEMAMVPTMAMRAGGRRRPPEPRTESQLRRTGRGAEPRIRSLRAPQADRSGRCRLSSTRARTAASSSTRSWPRARSAARWSRSRRSAARTAARSSRTRAGSCAHPAAHHCCRRLRLPVPRLRPERPPGRPLRRRHRHRRRAHRPGPGLRPPTPAPAPAGKVPRMRSAAPVRRRFCTICGTMAG